MSVCQAFNLSDIYSHCPTAVVTQFETFGFDPAQPWAPCSGEGLGQAVRGLGTGGPLLFGARHAMMAAVAQFSFVIPAAETRDLAGDLRELFSDLDATLPPEQRVYSGECHPSLDVLETQTAVEVIVDVAGVPAQAIRILFRGDTLVIAGEKAPGPPAADPTFHLVEREFGRFARAVRLTGAFDVSRARASLTGGELTIVLPRLVDRRGQPHIIPLTTGDRS
jgi:HSP20 family molecular chaperone IbpA